MSDELACMMAAIRLQESGGNYNAYNPGSGAAGAYQFTTGTWQSTLAAAGLGGYIGQYPSAHYAPAWLQDAAARWLMYSYYTRWHNWEFVARAWYGGPGSVNHPEWGGGPGYPNVGQYGQQVMAKFYNCGGTNLVSSPGPGIPDPMTIGPYVDAVNAFNTIKWWDGVGTPFESATIASSAW